ncbi:MAG: hypothetical protein ACI8PZ_003211 [Myxococcota bacterium]|jgi:hypothetical protein
MIQLAIVGLGRAGRARLRALEDHPRARCVATVSRRSGPSLESVLARPGVHAVLVCTENAAHPEQVHAALDAGKHVAVEFPVASDAATVRALHAQADAAGRVLHTELIGQLTGRFRGMQQVIGDAARVDWTFSGGFDGWIAAEAAAGHHAVLATARLHSLWTLVGPLTLEQATLDRSADGYRLSVQLRGRIPATLVEERRVGGSRRGEVVLTGGSGPLSPPGLPSPPLFHADLDVFLDRITSGGPGYVPPSQVIAVAELCDAITASVA